MNLIKNLHRSWSVCDHVLCMFIFSVSPMCRKVLSLRWRWVWARDNEVNWIYSVILAFKSVIFEQKFPCKGMSLSWNGTVVEAGAFPWRVAGGQILLAVFILMDVLLMRLAIASTRVPFQLRRFALYFFWKQNFLISKFFDLSRIFWRFFHVFCRWCWLWPRNAWPRRTAWSNRWKPLRRLARAPSSARIRPELSPKIKWPWPIVGSTMTWLRLTPKPTVPYYLRVFCHCRPKKLSKKIWKKKFLKKIWKNFFFKNLKKCFEKENLKEIRKKTKKCFWKKGLKRNLENFNVLYKTWFKNVFKAKFRKINFSLIQKD